MQSKALCLLKKIFVDAAKKEDKPIDRVIPDKYKIKEALEALQKEIEEKKKDINFLQFFEVFKTFYNYSFNNVILIFKQRPNATFVAGFNTWMNKYNRHVKKGERGIQILAPVFKKVEEETLKEETLEEETRKLIGFKTVYVFDITQTTQMEDRPVKIREYLPVPKPQEEQMRVIEELYKKLIEYTKKEKIPVRFVTASEIGIAKGTTDGKIIKVLNGLPINEKFFVLIHELVHYKFHFVYHPSTGKPSINPYYSRSFRELEAETVVHLLGKFFGVDTGSVAYLAHWQDKENLIDTARDVFMMYRKFLQIFDAKEILPFEEVV